MTTIKRFEKSRVAQFCDCVVVSVRGLVVKISLYLK